MMASYWDNIQHFEPKEWQKDPGKASPVLVYAVDNARHMAGVPIIIHACWDDSGHSEQSYHYTGQAVDFHFEPGLTKLQEFSALAAQPEIGAIGYYPEWQPRPGWHVDVRNWNSGRLYWSRQGGIYQYGVRAL